MRLADWLELGCGRGIESKIGQARERAKQEMFSELVTLNLRCPWDNWIYQSGVQRGACG